MIKRRELLALLGGAAAAWPLAARGQPSGKVWRIGFLVGYKRSFRNYDGFVQGMRELGYVEGKDFVSELRFTEGQNERIPDLAAELVRLRVDILFTALAAAVRSLQQATHSIPIVFVSISDPVGLGFITSLAHPGGNTTGLAGSFDDTSPKRMQLLLTAAPGLARVGLLQNPDNSSSSLPNLRAAQEAAHQAGLSLILMDARSPEEIDHAFAALGNAGVQAVMVGGDALFFRMRQQIAELALKNHVPSISPQGEYARAGGLMSYGEDLADFYRRGASYVDKIIKGASAGDLPVEQPTRFHLVINLKTAKTLGLSVPPRLVAIADEVIE
jgi:putative ABC transport system substrate-binding protein